MLFDNIKKIEITSPGYPMRLKEIKKGKNFPPKELYYQGDISLVNEACFAVVGARRFSSYGKQVVYDIVGQLVDIGFIIVSGIAPGIDTLAHQIVVERNAKTIAVLGTGIDKKSFYPKSNIKLAQKIIEQGGCIISEYPPGTSATKFTFPQRNRIIAGISLGILVIEARLKSGSLITANYGFNQNKNVFAIPNSIYSQNSKGCNQLIKKGAKLVENIGDILSEFQKLNLDFNLKIDYASFTAKTVTGKTREEEIILNILKKIGNPVDLEKIGEESQLSPAVILSTIANLEIDNKIQDLGNNTYSLKKP